MLQRSVIIALVMCISGLLLEVTASAGGLHLASGAGRDQFGPDYTVKQLCEFAKAGELIPIDGIGTALGLQYPFPPLTNLTVGNIIVR